MTADDSGESRGGSAKEKSDADRPSRRLKLALLGIAILLVVASPYWGPLLMRRSAFFRVRRVEIVGARYVAASDILAKLHIDTMASVWEATAPLAQRVASHPGIRSAVVRRKLPGTLVVEIAERFPVALVPTATGFRVYDERGVALPIPLSQMDLPVLAQRDTALLRLLASVRWGIPTLYDRISAVRRVGVGRDEVLLELNTIPVRAMADVSLDRLAEIEPVELDLARRQVRPLEIDLRYRDQVIARLQ